MNFCNLLPLSFYVWRALFYLFIAAHLKYVFSSSSWQYLKSYLLNLSGFRLLIVCIEKWATKPRLATDWHFIIVSVNMPHCWEVSAKCSDRPLKHLLMNCSKNVQILFFCLIERWKKCSGVSILFPFWFSFWLLWAAAWIFTEFLFPALFSLAMYFRF